MFLRKYREVSAFLARAEAALEAQEVTNSLMLGLCYRLQRAVGRGEQPPYLATVEDPQGLVMAALMTPPHNMIVYGHRPDLGDAPDLVAEDLWETRWPTPGVVGPAETSRRFAESWSRIAGRAPKARFQQWAYVLTELLPPRPVPGRLRVATGEDVETIARWIYGFHQDIFGEADLEDARALAERRIGEGEIYVWEVDGQPVSMAAKARPTRHGISVNYVYTPPELRCRGYATACVAALSRLLLDSGWRFCTLFADVTNAPANHIYRSIGYRPACDFEEYVFT